MECELIDMLGNQYNEYVADKIEMPMDFSLQPDFFSFSPRPISKKVKLEESVDQVICVHQLAEQQHSKKYKEHKENKRQSREKSCQLFYMNQQHYTIHEMLKNFIYLQSELQDRFKDDGTLERKRTRDKIEIQLNGYRNILEATQVISENKNPTW